MSDVLSGKTTPLEGVELAPAAGTLGQVVADKYELVRLVGRGGMGAVYEARHLVTLKRCALKLLSSPELVQHPGIVKRFFREAKASAVVESEHIVQVFDSGTDTATNAPYIAMELLDGEDLEVVVKRLGALPPDVACRLLFQAATGLSKAHSLGIVHRDIKPANLFLSQRENGELIVKLLDFGIAKVKMENFHETSQGLTQTGSMLGTPLYMSPEQARGASNIDARSDVWSLGIVLYELLSGGLPYGQIQSLGELMVGILTTPIALLQDRAPWVPAEVAEVVHHALSRDLDRRYESAAQLAQALEPLCGAGAVLPSELVSVPADQRALYARRLELSEQGILRVSTKSGMAVTQDSVAEPSLAPPPPRTRWLLLSAVGVLAVGAAAVGARFSRAQELPETPAQSAIAETPAPSSSESSAPVVTTASHFELEVSPAGVRVTVDGEPVEVKDGTVALQGTPGETRKVVLEADGQRREHTVAITRDGLLPAELKLRRADDKTPPAQPNRRARSGDPPTPPAAKATASPKAPAPAPKPPKPKGTFDTSTDEFK